jgi:Protein of unknown function (DUF3093)
VSTPPHSSAGSGRAASGYRERLRVPLRWWLLLVLFLASLWLAMAVSTPLPVTLAATALAVLLGAGLLLGYGAARIEAEDAGLRAGRARLEWTCCGPAVALDPEATRRLRGVDADPRAFLLLRPYIATAVRVEVADADDPTPYWMLSTRDPEALAEVVNAARLAD